MHNFDPACRLQNYARIKNQNHMVRMPKCHRECMNLQNVAQLYINAITFVTIHQRLYGKQHKTKSRDHVRLTKKQRYVSTVDITDALLFV